jgi:type II secretory pathway component PulC
MLLPLLLQAALAAPPADLAALGAVFGRPRAAAVAILRSGGKTRVVAVGESAFGGRLVSVDARAAVLEYGSGRVEVPLVAAATPRAEAATRTSIAARRDDAPGARTMERKEVERRLGEEVPRILAETTVVPVTEDGRVTGLALTKVPEGTLLTDAGLQAGDVLTRVNDTVVDGLPSLMALWPRLQGASQLQAVVLRNGQPVSLTITLR